MSFSWGPREPWATIEDLTGEGGCAASDVSGPLVAAVLDGVSEVLHILTARVIPGRASATVRLRGPVPGRVRLPGPNPVVASVTWKGTELAGPFVIVDGEFLQPADSSTVWPLNELAGDDDILEITVTAGPSVPLAAKTACIELACTILHDLRRNNCSNLAPGVTGVSFQGTSIQVDPKEVLAAQLGSVRLLIELVNPLAQRTPSEVWSPDLAEGELETREAVELGD